MHRRNFHKYVSHCVAVIIPCYNQAQFLPECLDSVLAQEFSDWVCMIVDDGSRDNTREIAKTFADQDARVRYIWQENRGLGAARNAGIRNSDSMYILPLDADDCLHPTYLQKTIAAIEAHPDVKLIYTGCRFFGVIEEEMQIRKYSYQELLRGNIFPATALYRRRDYQNSPGYREDMLIGWEDWDFWLSLLGPEDRVYQVEETLFFYRRKEVSMIARLEDESKRRELRRQIFLNHREVYNRYFEDPINLYHRVNTLEQELRIERRKNIPARILRWVKGLFSI